MASSTSGLTFSDAELKAMPVNTGFESIALLAPGTAAPGSANFNGASSFGGSSAAENGYYFNGLNVTSIRTGLGSIRLPWEAISQTQVKTGGVSPEFGGVSNYERGVDSFLDELKAKLAKQKSDPESTEKEILATENEITYLESIHENFYIGMNVFRTAKGGRDKISA